MPSDATLAAICHALSVAMFEGDDHASVALDALREAMVAGPEHVESLADAINEWDADHESEPAPVLPAWSRPHDGRPSR